MISQALSLLSRVDSLYNSVTGAGTTQDRSAYGSFVLVGDIPDYELEALWKGSGVARKISSVFAEETMRQGIVVGGVTPPDGERIAKRCAELDMFQRIQEAMIWGRHYGRGLVVLGALDGRTAKEELVVDAITDLRFVDVYDKRDVFQQAFYADPAHPKFGQVAIWRITVPGGQIRYVHESRCIPFGGALTSKRDQVNRDGADHSVIQGCYKNLLRFESVYYSAENLVNDASIGVYAMRGLVKALGGLGLAEMRIRAQAMDLMRSVARSIIVDAEKGESYTRTSVSFSGLSDMMDRFAGLLALDSGIPVPILMGEAPAGLNATGDAPVRLFYDRVRTGQRSYTPDIERALLIVARSLGIHETPTCEWPSLWQLTPAEQDAHLTAEAANDKVYIDSMVLLPEEVAKMRFAGNPAVDLELRETNESGTLALTPSDAATVVTVNEARASMGLSPLPDVEAGAMSLAAYRAKLEGGGGGPAQLPEGGMPEGDSAPDERKTDESVEHFAARMTEKQIERCVHGRPNRCPQCGIERVRDIDDATGAFTVGWRAIAK